MIYSIEHIQEVINGKFLNENIQAATITNIVYDSRKVSFHEQSIFFALSGPKADGHDYLMEAYNKGIGNFVVSQKINLTNYPKANFILCNDTLAALQELAGYHRAALSCPTVAITGSNGKTIVKEWLAIALEQRYEIGKSPLSFNSQLGVALSILQLEKETELAIIEAGISTRGEMFTLEAIIKPHLGILTNIGDAHSQGFSSEEEKLKEKLSLFQGAQLIIYNKDMTLVDRLINESHSLQNVSWGYHPESDIILSTYNRKKAHTEVALLHGSDKFQIDIPFTNKDFCENALHVISYLILDNWNESDIQLAVSRFSSLPNRLEIKQGRNNCILINDSYTLDHASLQLALEKMETISNSSKRVVFLSAFDQQNSRPDSSALLSDLLIQKGIDEIITVGMSEVIWKNSIKTSSYSSTEECVRKYNFDKLQNATVLIKGARKYKLEAIFNELAEQVHQTSLETNLSAITHNLNFYRSRLEATTKIMAVVKAEAYGSGSIQMVRFLEEQKVDYLAVALIDEAVQLRKNGCSLPVMIFNIQKDNLSQLWTYELEPEVYDFSVLHKLSAYAKQVAQPLKIHLKIDSGMNRLGFLPSELELLSELLLEEEYLKIASIFSHLAASENDSMDAFTQQQFDVYDKAYELLVAKLALEGKLPLRHILNTAGIVRFADHQYDMARLGLGLYGIDEAQQVTKQLTKAHTLKAKVLQVKPLSKGDATGYNRSGEAESDIKIAIVSIGYGDGLLRSGGNGNLQFRIGNELYPTLGNICMDVTMLSLGPDSKVQQGDEVIVFGPDLPVENIAKACNTITYEVISRLAPRIKRTYIYD